MTSGEFGGQVVVVIGAARGVGQVIAEGFVRLGAQVVAADADRELPPTAVGAANNASTYVPADVRDRASVERLAQAVQARFGRADVLINCAVAGRHEPALTLPASEWSQAISTILSGTFNSSQAFAALMATQQKGAVINLISMDAYHAYPGRSSYAAAQAGIIGLTRALAVEWAPLGIRVNALAHGVGIAGRPGQAAGWGPAVMDRVQSRTPMHRLANPDEIIAGAVFLAGPRSGFMTGQVLRVDGGWAALNSAAPGLVFP